MAAMFLLGRPSSRLWGWGSRMRPHGRRGSWRSEWTTIAALQVQVVTLFSCYHRFNPDRFAPNGPHARRGLEFCPFGTPSRRKCPGYIFSYFEATIMAGILLRRFQVVPVPNQKVERSHGLLTIPNSEAYITVRER